MCVRSCECVVGCALWAYITDVSFIVAVHNLLNWFLGWRFFPLWLSVPVPLASQDQDLDQAHSPAEVLPSNLYRPGYSPACVYVGVCVCACVHFTGYPLEPGVPYSWQIMTLR